MERQLLPLAEGERQQGSVWAYVTKSQVWLVRGRVYCSSGLCVGQVDLGALQCDLRQGHSVGHQENTGAIEQRGQRLQREKQR